MAYTTAGYDIVLEMTEEELNRQNDAATADFAAVTADGPAFRTGPLEIRYRYELMPGRHRITLMPPGLEVRFPVSVWRIHVTLVVDGVAQQEIPLENTAPGTVPLMNGTATARGGLKIDAAPDGRSVQVNANLSGAVSYQDEASRSLDDEVGRMVPAPFQAQVLQGIRDGFSQALEEAVHRGLVQFAAFRPPIGIQPRPDAMGGPDDWRGRVRYMMAYSHRQHEAELADACRHPEDTRTHADSIGRIVQRWPNWGSTDAPASPPGETPEQRTERVQAEIRAITYNPMVPWDVDVIIVPRDGSPSLAVLLRTRPPGDLRPHSAEEYRESAIPPSRSTALVMSNEFLFGWQLFYSHADSFVGPPGAVEFDGRELVIHNARKERTPWDDPDQSTEIQLLRIGKQEFGSLAVEEAASGDKRGFTAPGRPAEARTRIVMRFTTKTEQKWAGVHVANVYSDFSINMWLVINAEGGIDPKIEPDLASVDVRVTLTVGALLLAILGVVVAAIVAAVLGTAIGGLVASLSAGLGMVFTTASLVGAAYIAFNGIYWWLMLVIDGLFFGGAILGGWWPVQRALRDGIQESLPHCREERVALLDAIRSHIRFEDIGLDDLVMPLSIPWGEVAPICSAGTAELRPGEAINLDSGLVEAARGGGPHELEWNRRTQNVKTGPNTVMWRLRGDYERVSVSMLEERGPLLSEVPRASLPVGPMDQPPTAAVGLGLLTNSGRLAKCQLWRTATGMLACRFQSFCAKKPEVRLAQAWSETARRSVGSGYDPLEHVTTVTYSRKTGGKATAFQSRTSHVRYDDYEVARHGTFLAHPRGVAWPLRYDWAIRGEAVSGEGEIQVHGKSIRYKAEESRLQVWTDLGEDFEAEVCVKVRDNRGNEVRACVPADQDGVVRYGGNPDGERLLDEFHLPTKEERDWLMGVRLLPPTPGPDPEGLGQPAVKPIVQLERVAMASRAFGRTNVMKAYGLAGWPFPPPGLEGSLGFRPPR